MTPEDYNADALGIHDTGTITDLVRIAQTHLGLDVDGRFGPKTRAAVAAWAARVAVRLPKTSRAARVLERMRRIVGRGKYRLGTGGRDPRAVDPFNDAGESDCSGAVCWALEERRAIDADGDGDTDAWRNTDHLEADARGNVLGDIGYMVLWQDAHPGDLVVYGKGPKVGHIGVVSEADASGPVRVIHCNSGAPPAVDETGPEVFRRNGAVILRPR